jgi:hypothetical protein
MNCEHCHHWIQQRLDGHDGADAPEVERHLAECARCAALYAASCRLGRGVRLLAPPQPPLDFTERLVAAVLADRRAQHRRARLRLVAYSLAASLLIAGASIGMYISGWLTFGKTSQPTSIVHHDEAPPTPPKPNLAPPLRESVSDAGSALASLTTRTADETVGQTRLLVPMVTGPSLDDLEAPPGMEPTKSYLEAGQGVSVALEPVTNSAQRAVNLFRRDLPQVKKSEVRDSKSEIPN